MKESKTNVAYQTDSFKCKNSLPKEEWQGRQISSGRPFLDVIQPSEQVIEYYNESNKI